MLNQLRKTVFFVLTLCFLAISTPVVLAVNEPLTVDTTTSSQMDLVRNDINVKDLDIDPINTEKVKKSVVPDSRKEGKKVIGLFLKTMAAVAFCAVILYVILIFVKKFYGSAFVPSEYDEFETLDLSTPATKTDALKSFLNRTK